MAPLTHLTALLTVVTLSTSSVVKSPTSKDGTFELLILHNNDMHARFEQTSQLSGTCTPADRDAGKCYGGFPRVAHVVKEARKAAASGEGPPVLYLNAGDTYTGTAWFTLYKWKIAAEFVNALQPDAVSLGNHELDDAVDGLVPFIRNLTAPVLAANLVLGNVPALQNEPNLHKSIILTINGVKVGVIGYLTPETKYLAPRNEIEYEDEVRALRREVKNLKGEGVKIFIALGHSGYIKDLEIGKRVEDIDLVIGGHSNTFLWNSNTSEIPEYPQGPYPMVVTQPSGRKVPVVQAYAYTKYMGRLHLKFDSNGELTEYDGAPLLLNQDVPRDSDLLEVVKKYHQRINVVMNEVVGSSMVALDGENCRLNECNIGNLINDAMLYYTHEYYYVDHGDVNIAITQGGRIRASIVKNEQVPFNITREDWLTVLPFSDTLTVITLNGSILMKALEHSVDTWRTIDSTGQFLQMSGMRVVYDLARPAGFRVVKAQAVCSSCDNTELSDIQEDNEYKLITSTFIADSGDGYDMFEGLVKETLPYNEITALLSYFKVNSPVSPKVSNRIQLLNSEVLRNTEAVLNGGSGVNEVTFTPRSKGYSNSYPPIYHLIFLCFCLLQLDR